MSEMPRDSQHAQLSQGSHEAKLSVLERVTNMSTHGRMSEAPKEKQRAQPSSASSQVPQSLHTSHHHHHHEPPTTSNTEEVLSAVSTDRQDTINSSPHVQRWKEYIRRHYPGHLTKPYFIPSVFQNRTSYTEEERAGRKILVPKQPVKKNSKGQSKGELFDSDVCDDNAQRRVVGCFQAMVERHPQAMFMLYFASYLSQFDEHTDLVNPNSTSTSFSSASGGTRGLPQPKDQLAAPPVDLSLGRQSKLAKRGLPQPVEHGQLTSASASQSKSTDFGPISNPTETTLSHSDEVEKSTKPQQPSRLEDLFDCPNLQTSRKATSTEAILIF
jgi:hypothetical protein